MKNTICCPLAQLGFENDYIITEQGQIIDTANKSQLQLGKKCMYSLTTKEGKRVRRSLKSIYRLAFGREYAEDVIEDLPFEEWKPIDEQGKYYVSSLGRVKSFQGTKTRILKPYTNQKGYYRVDICLGKRKTVLVHQLVARAFVYNDDPQTKDTIDHINGDKRNNTAENLRWLSRGDNVRAYFNSKRKGDKNNENITQPKDNQYI